VFLSNTQVIPKPGVQNRILCFRQEPAAIDKYFVAQKVYDELSRKYHIKKDVQQFPKFNLSRATLGFDIETVSAKVHTAYQGGGALLPAVHGPPELRIRSFSNNSEAIEGGLQIGDQILSLDDVSVSDLKKVELASEEWEVGQNVRVTFRRHGKEQTVSVPTTFNPVLHFRKESDLKCSVPLTKKDVVLLRATDGQRELFPIAEYTDWENPADSMEQFQNYVIEYAVNSGANGVLVLNSHEEIKQLFPEIDPRVGFICLVGLLPKFHLGVEFEMGQGFENRRVIRRIHNADAEKAGLRIGDNILAVNGIDVIRDKIAFEENKLKWNSGETVQVTIARDGKELTLPITVVSNFR